MKIGVIGCGVRMRGILDAILKYELGIEVAAVTDVNIEKAKENLAKINAGIDKIRFYSDADQMLENEQLDSVLIGTRCSLHSNMAVKVLRKNRILFLEKPVATNMQDLIALREAGSISGSKVLVSFPLRVTPIIKLAKEIIDSGKIGTVEHIQATNNVPYGGVYYHSWYRDDQETGGLFLQKATHDFDYITYLSGQKPVKICAMKSKQIFKGTKPAGLKCCDCNENETCRESPFYKKFMAYSGANGELCSFAVDTGNEDSGSAIIAYENGMHASYSQNFFARNGAATRGARILGYEGTLEFDWYSNELKVFMHHTPRTDSYKFDSGKVVHFGGDSILAYNFIQIMRGSEEPLASLEDGLLSALMCLKAKESAEKYEFNEINWV